MSSTTMPDGVDGRKPLPALLRFFAFFAAQIAAGGLAGLVVTGFVRSAAVLVLVPLITMLLCTCNRFRSRYAIVIIAAATVGTLATIHLVRTVFSATWFVGPVPPGLELAAYGGLALVTLVCAGCTCVSFAFTGILRHARWPVVGVLTAFLASLAVWAKSSVWEASPSMLLRTIARLEEQEPRDSATMQQLSVLLAECGREADAEAMSHWDVNGGGFLRRDSKLQKLDLTRFQARPWRETFTAIAKRERLIVIMEAHNSPKHRQWIEQTLGILREAGFRDYAAEGLGESGRSLKQRGYPVTATGFYVSDPHFGNVLRTAIDLDFDLHAYEAYGRKDYAEREYGQAANLAKLFVDDPKLKLVVHAGYGHVLKKPLETGEKMMAAHLWEMTRIEPYCIWQTWHSSEDGEARQLAALVDPGGEPVMLVPPPSGLHDYQFQFPAGGVDALVVHPPGTGGPAERVHSFPSERRRIAGVWKGSGRPVIVGVFKKGEPTEAIALDQVMLRNGEREFVLWVPDVEYELRVFGMKGRLDVDDSRHSTLLEIKSEEPRAKRE